MTTSTIIPYRAGKQYAPADGPTNCTRCARFLLDRTSDKVEDSWDGPTELTVHIWEHDVDSEGRALCPSCTEVDDQTEAWRQIVAWKWRSEKRSHILSNSGLELFDDYRSVAMFAAKDGKLDVGLVLAFVGRDPLRPGVSSRPGKMTTDIVEGDLVDGGGGPSVDLSALAKPSDSIRTRWLRSQSATPRFELLAGDMHEATMEMGANLRADDECPETERNTER